MLKKNKVRIFGILILTIILSITTGYTDDNDKPLKDKKIVIDPGHGGDKAGARGPTGLLEKDVNLAVALKLKALLESAGATVIMTRENDVYIEQYQRAKIANDAKADYFISIHFNAGEEGDHETNFTQGCYHPNDTIGKELATILQEYLHDALGIPQSGPSARPDLIVLNSTKMPRVLMECSFISCTEEEKLLKGEARRQQITQAI